MGSILNAIQQFTAIFLVITAISGFILYYYGLAAHLVVRQSDGRDVGLAELLFWVVVILLISMVIAAGIIMVMVYALTHRIIP